MTIIKNMIKAVRSFLVIYKPPNKEMIWLIFSQIDYVRNYFLDPSALYKCLVAG